MLLYNSDGTVTNLIINAIVDGKVTSSIESAPGVINDTYIASASNARIINATNAGSSSAQALGLGYPTSTNTSNLGYTYKSSVTSVKTYSTASYAVLNPTSADLHTRGQRKTIMVSADSSFNSVIDDRVALTIGTSLTDASVSPKFNTINASKFTTTYSNGTVLVVGDDTYIKDSNLQNGFNLVGQQNQYRAFVRFGENGPLIGHNGNVSTLPAPGDVYAYTGSMIVSASKLMYYNGSGATNGWAAIK
jgi:hypothetical protein